AAGLHRLGVAKGDRVTVCLQNVPELVYSYFGIAKLGAITAWSNPAYRLEEIEFTLKNSGSKVAIFHRELKDFDYLKMLGGIRNRLPDLEQVVMLDPKEGEEVIDYRKLMDEHAGKSFERPPIDIRKDYVLFYNTGGTTGIPKAAAHTHYTSIMRGTVSIDPLEVTADDVTIAQLPLFHPLGGATALVLPLATQGSVVMMTEFHVEPSLQLIQEHGVTLYHCAPAHIVMSTRAPNFKQYDLSSLRTGLAGGFVWPPEVFDRAYNEMHLDLVHHWGMAEIGGIGILCSPKEDRQLRYASIGKALEGEAAVKDPATGTLLPPGVAGELVYRGGIFQEYWNNPAETARSFDSEGWFHTGDMVMQDEAGFLRMMGRLKEQINRGGLKIVPAELESLLVEHPKIKEICVTSTPNPVLGESICACVIPVGEDKPTLLELRTFLEDKIAKYKLPDELCIFESFPRLAGGVKYRKFGPGSIQDLATQNEARERLRR
ncbi:MAG TPA: class I adenylate-forming enzyme family protein, partial [Deferrisomatales bacterium]|nr:class I adenylate-forming enzyme family protein [Deferrisomatales bacterium]